MTDHLIHIGFPKTGSNYLRAWYRRHPQLEYADGGIAGFHNVFQLAKRGAAPRPGVRYHVTSAEHLSAPTADAGDPVHTYQAERWSGVVQAQSATCDLLAGLFGTARILCLTRGFRSMILSSYSQFVRAGGTLGFTEFCDSIHDDPSGVVWDYDRLLTLYRRAFLPRRCSSCPTSCCATILHDSFGNWRAGSVSIDAKPRPIASTPRSRQRRSSGIPGSLVRSQRHRSAAGCGAGSSAGTSVRRWRTVIERRFESPRSWPRQHRSASLTSPTPASTACAGKLKRCAASALHTLRGRLPPPLACISIIWQLVAAAEAGWKTY